MKMKRKSVFQQLLLIAYFFILPTVIKVDYCICTTCSKAQQCLQANEGGGILPNFVDRGNQGRILHRNQAIISSYEFKCCGKITEWGADVYSNPVRDNEDDDSDSDDGNVVTQTFNIQFQVWRPSPTVESDGCYSLVGENRFTSISLQTGVIRETPLVPQQIAVQPGDIVGFRLEGEYPSANPGVVLDSSYSNESVWYGNIDGITPGPSNCPYPVGSIGRLRTSTNLGPVILASLATTVCPTPTTSLQQSSSTSSSPTSSSLTSSTTIPPVTFTTNQASTEPTTSDQGGNDITSRDEYTPTEQNGNELAIGGSDLELATATSTARNSSPSISTKYTIIILTSGVGVVFLLFIVLIVVSVFVCRRVNQDKVQSQTKDLQVSQGDMDHNSAYSSSFDGNNLPGGAFYNTQRNYNNSFFASDTMIIDSEPIYDDIVY